MKFGDWVKTQVNVCTSCIAAWNKSKEQLGDKVMHILANNAILKNDKQYIGMAAVNEIQDLINIKD